MELEPTIIAIERAKSITDLSVLLAEWRDSTNVAHLVYHAANVPACNRPNPILLLTYEDPWVKRYVEQNYFQIDPVVAAGRNGFLPIDWMGLDHGSPAARQFFAEAESHGVGRHGITLPIRGPYGERALFSVTSNATDHQWHRWRHDHLRDFHLLAHHLHDRAMTLAGLRPNPAPRPLSRRERQCLHQLVHGRTPQQIADSLQVSTGAVHLYLRSARRKLDCATVEQTIGKAVCFELIHYSNVN